MMPTTVSYPVPCFPLQGLRGSSGLTAGGVEVSAPCGVFAETIPASDPDENMNRGEFSEVGSAGFRATPPYDLPPGQIPENIGC